MDDGRWTMDDGRVVYGMLMIVIVNNIRVVISRFIDAYIVTPNTLEHFQ